MGYSYNDFVTKAKGAGMLKKFSQEDLSIAQRSPEYGMSMLGLMQDEQNATTAEGRLLAQEAAKTLRNNYVLKGQVAAKQAEINGVGSFTYDKDDEISALQEKIVNQEEFSYDHEQDPLYKSMRQSAIRDSKRAVEDTLARASVGTGGVPSSYAVAAAQQAANNYLGQLDDAVPTLYQNALAKHENDLNMNLKRLAALEGDRDTQLRLYQDGLDRLGTELNQLKASAAAGDTSYLKILQQIQEQQEEDLDDDPKPTDVYFATLAQAEQREAAEAAAIKAAQQAVALKSPQEQQRLEQLKQDNKVPVYRNPVDPLAGITAADVSGNIAARALPAAVWTGLKSAYPNGMVTDATIWAGLVAEYGEDMLSASGFRYVQPASGTPQNSKNLGGRPMVTTANSLR